MNTPKEIVRRVFVAGNDPDALCLVSDHETARLMRRAIEADRPER